MDNIPKNGSKSVDYHKCSFTGCSRSRARCPSLHFFSFPTKRTEICNQWVLNCANDYLNSLTIKTLNKKIVCEVHFTKECFTSTMKTQLTKNAVPTLLSLDDGVSPQTPSPQPAETDVQLITNTSSPSNEPAARRALFPTGTPTTHANQSTTDDSPISTPLYKKFKSIKNRKPTPGKLTPQKRRLLSKLKGTIKMKKKYQQAAKRALLGKRIIKKEDLVTSIKAYLPEKVSNFFAMQLNHVDQTTKPYTDEEKQQALTMRYKSPALYDQMRSDGFSLPSPATIARWLQGIDLRAGVCGDLLHFFKNKVSCMSEMEKKTVIMFDEMSMKHGLEYDSKRDMIEGLVDLGEDGRHPLPGSKILLFMVRGLIHKWKMPAAFYIVDKKVNAKTISKLIRRCVSALSTTGLDIKAVVCDQGSTNRTAASMLQVTKVQPFFKVGDKNIYLLYDFPHVIKCIRNNLMKFPIITNEGTADWKHVEKLYELDRASVKARATKLTDKHLNPNSFEKMSVKLATQVFSHSVSSAMKTAVQTEQLPIEAGGTAHFLCKLNNIFDSMNSCSKFHPNPQKCAISNSENDHLKMPLATLAQALKWVKSWARLGPNPQKPLNRPPSFEGFEHTLTGTLMLWEDIKKEGVAYLLTGRLNQDPLENEFSIARQKCGYDRNPTARRFRQNIRHRIQTSLLKPPAGKNCESDDDEALTYDVANSMKAPTTSRFEENGDAGDGLISQASENEDEEEVDECFGDILPSTSTKLTLEANSVRYFAGYSVMSCLRKFKCTNCKDELTKKPVDGPSDMDMTPAAPDEHLIKHRVYKKTSGTSGLFGGLTNPNDVTTDLVTIVLGVFEKHFKKNIHVVGIRRKLIFKSKQHLNNKNASWLKLGSECEDHRSYIIDRIVTAKIHRALSEISKDMRQPGGVSKGRAWRKLQNITNN